jgi:hypothetical protein
MKSLDFRIRIRAGEEEAEESLQAEWLRKYAMRTIKRFSHMKDEEELAAFISVNFTIEEPAELILNVIDGESPTDEIIEI